LVRAFLSNLISSAILKRALDAGVHVVTADDDLRGLTSRCRPQRHLVS
jgi:hypothetical protein